MGKEEGRGKRERRRYDNNMRKGFDGQQSSNIGLYDFAVLGTTNVRVDSEVSAGVGSALNNAQVQNV